MRKARRLRLPIGENWFGLNMMQMYIQYSVPRFFYAIDWLCALTPGCAALLNAYVLVYSHSFPSVDILPFSRLRYCTVVS